jgi:hypothetical protein|tara:strand:+ start:398 stop:514 length:117 start_codon:yes stop_codon:yes gene_type:complete
MRFIQALGQAKKYALFLQFQEKTISTCQSLKILKITHL